MRVTKDERRGTLADIRKLLDVVIEKNASDLHLSVGRPPVLRIHGRLHDMPLPKLEPADTESLVRTILPDRNLAELEKVGSTDFGYPYEDRARFRVSAFRQKGVHGVVMRLIPSKILTFEEIGLPQALKSLLSRPRGLILVTGPTGSGKTTTLATMVDTINTEFDRHIVTIEDPIEYYHAHKKSVVTQREVGVDVPAFSEGLRRALRQDPDVVLLGEMRDLETISAAITAAETGHLVFGPLHTTGSTRTVDRIIDAYPAEQQDQIRAQLAVSIIAVISQVLLPRSDKPGMIAAFEVLLMNSAVENHIRKNETFKITSVIQTSKRMGMFLLDEFLYDLHRAGKISFSEMMGKAQNPKELEEKARGVSQP